MVSTKLPAALIIIALSQGLQVTLAQNVADCTDIAADLNTMPIEPVTGKPKVCIPWYIAAYMALHAA